MAILSRLLLSSHADGPRGLASTVWINWQHVLSSSSCRPSCYSRFPIYTPKCSLWGPFLLIIIIIIIIMYNYLGDLNREEGRICYYYILILILILILFLFNNSIS